MQTGKIVAGLLGLMVVAACGAPASVTPTPLNPVAVQANTMQSYGPGSTMSTDSYLDSAPAVATGEEEEMPAEEPAAVEEAAPEPQATATPAPEPEPTEEPVVPIMDSGDDYEEAPPKTGILQKAKSFVGNVVNKAVCLFKKDC